MVFPSGNGSLVGQPNELACLYNNSACQLTVKKNQLFGKEEGISS
jgi:hypothetical protein